MSAKPQLASCGTMGHGSAWPNPLRRPRSRQPPRLAPKPKPLPLDEAILDALTRNGAGTLSPPEIAHVIEPEGDWHALLMPIRRAAVTLALADRLVIYRKAQAGRRSQRLPRRVPAGAAEGGVTHHRFFGPGSNSLLRPASQ